MTPKKGIEAGLNLEHNIAIPALQPHECLIKIANVSLNYRDVAMLKDQYPMPTKDTVIPCSDASGTILAVGSAVKLHKVGDRVCTLFNQEHLSGFMTTAIRKASLGGLRDGVLRQYATFPETGLVPIPRSLNLREAATLPCAAVTAWNALFGIEGRSLKKGDWLLVQGTGGVSLFAAQFGIAMGARVIATTSSEEKVEALKTMGVEYVINYRKEKDWGIVAKKFTEEGEGVHHVIEVGGETTMSQSLKAVRCEGVISLIGFLGGKGGEKQLCGFADCFQNLSIVRGVNVGSREQFVAMNEFIDKHGIIKPIVDKTAFTFEDTKEAYQYMLDAKHMGKIVINVAGEEK